MLVRIDVRDTTVVALEMQAAWRDHTVEGLDGRARGAASGRAGSGLDEGADDLTLVLGRAPIVPHPRSWRLHPGGQVRGISRMGWGDGHCRKATRTELRKALHQEDATVDAAPP